MKQSIFIFFMIIIFYILLGGFINETKLIPDEAIRIRIIPNSNLEEDQQIKLKVKNQLENKMYKLLKDVKGIDEARNIINSNLDSIDKNIKELFINENYDKKFDVNFGLNYFPEKEYKGVKYDEGYYESLLVTIGDGKGDNWWCVLFPPLCILEADESSEIEYTSFVKEMIDKYL